MGGVEVLPLVVLDTKAAVLELENENDNSEASAAMAILKQGFEGLPVWLVGHIAKQNMGRTDAAGLSLRGGSAFEADANQVLYLMNEGGIRYLVRGKTRFEAWWPELQIDSHTAQTMAKDEFGGQEKVIMRWGIACPPMTSSKEAAEQAKDQVRKADAADMRGDVRDAVATAWKCGFPLNREGVKAKMKRNRKQVTDCIENLLSERWLYEVQIPIKERTNPKRSAFLVCLTTDERDALTSGMGLPLAKIEVPQSWKKALTSNTPEHQAAQEAKSL